MPARRCSIVFSEDNKFRTWRRLWIALARAEQKQGLEITDEQIAELEAHKDDINYEVAQRREQEVPPRRDEPCIRLRASSAPRRRASSIWAPPPATWGTTPM